MNLPVFHDDPVCAECGHCCSSTVPGHTTPEQWGAPDKDEMVRRMTDAFQSGDWSIDWWDGGIGDHDGDVLSVRPRHVDHPSKQLRDPTWGGHRCVFLTPSGCKLPANERPMCCQTLEPKRGGRCVTHLSKEDAHRLWIPYQQQILDAEKTVGGDPDDYYYDERPVGWW